MDRSSGVLTGATGADPRGAPTTPLHNPVAEGAADRVRHSRTAAIASTGLAAAAATGVVAVGGIRATEMTARGAAVLLVLVSAVSGLVAVRSAAHEVAGLVQPRGGPAAAGAVRLLVLVAGCLLEAVVVLGLLQVPVERLLLSGAITGVALGIAAQQSLSNAFAGLVLLIARPFVIGEQVTVRGGPLGGPYDGQVAAIGLLYTTLLTTEGPLHLPNSGLLAAATGPRAGAGAVEPAPRRAAEEAATCEPGSGARRF